MPTQHIVGRTMLRATLLQHVGSNLTTFKLELTAPNMSPHGGQTHTTCGAQLCHDMLRWDVAIVRPGLKKKKTFYLHDTEPVSETHLHTNDLAQTRSATEAKAS